jgi:hypothetical protein
MILKMTYEIEILCEHSRLCRIPKPEHLDDLSKSLDWLHQRFGASLSAELISEAMASIIRAFYDKRLDKLTDFEFLLTVRYEHK